MSSTTIPTTQKALLLPSKGGALSIEPFPVPTLGSGEVLVRLAAAALNPIDVAMQMFGLFIEVFPAVIGCDGAGEIVAIGEGVEGFSAGDRVAVQGTIDMMKKEIHGTYAQYVATPAKFLIKLPDSVSFDAGATMPCTLPTAALVLYNKDENVTGPRLDAPWTPGGRGKYAGKAAVVLGGSSSVGQYAIQFARLSGFSPIVATASPAHAAHLTALGATHVLDRALPAADLEAAARALAPAAGFALAFDAVSLPETLPLGYALAADGADLVVVSPPGTLGEGERKTVKVHMARGLLAIPTNAAVVEELLGALPGMLAAGDVKPNPVEVLEGGLAGVPGGLERVKMKQVSGVKLVVHPQATA
ncbi:GroES-like protein [Epithele typhae]|uniref:GroES-like protein n=1 Tax=Epithele typhae TaxID=378194 RepID=UPI002008999A|nr:GroES-like protein [Epithele typhae]KAH9925652.1 GroES-like protein [Epithele typhae]